MSGLTFGNAQAALRDHTVRWLPSPSQGVEGYELSVATTSGQGETVIDLGSPAVQSGEMQLAVELEDSVDLRLRMRAYGGGLYSDFSNDVVLPAAASTPSYGIVRIGGATGVVSGDIVVVAETFGSPASVAFALDGVAYRVENVPPFALEGDGGSPGTENPFDTTKLTDGDHILVATAYSDSNASGVASDPLSVVFAVDNAVAPAPDPDPTPDPTPDPDPISDPIPPVGPEGAVAGVFATPDGDIHALHVDGSSRVLTSSPLAAAGDLRPTWCDVDGDTDRDLIIGFGSSSDAQILVLTMQDGIATASTTIQGAQSRYLRRNGETFPSCGDIDGDGRNEIVVGLGAGGWASVSLLDDQQHGFAPIKIGSGRARKKSVVRTLPDADLLGLDYLDAGEAKPVVADVDGDGFDEIIVGRSAGGRGTISIIDDARHDYRVLEHPALDRGMLEVVRDTAYREADGATSVAAADVDGDGIAEIVVGTGPKQGARIYVLDDANAGFALLESGGRSADFDHPGYDVAQGPLVPSLADIDEDGLPELVIGFGAGGGEGAVQLLDDLLTGFAPLIWTGDAQGIVETSPDFASKRVSPSLEAAP